MSFAISPYLNNIYKYRNTQVSQSSPGNIIFTLTDPVSDFQCPENTSYMTVFMVGGGGGGGSGGRGGLGGGGGSGGILEFTIILKDLNQPFFSCTVGSGGIGSLNLATPATS